MVPKLPLLLAPIRGLTDLVFRNVFFSHFDGLDGAIAPFITTLNSDTISSSHLSDINPKRNIIPNLTPQIIGNNANHIKTLLKAFSDLGYKTTNWNLGCPFKRIYQKKRGCGLLPFPDVICSILDTICPATNIKLSIKTRLGLKDETELERLLPKIKSYPIDFIIIHPRTGLQLYGGNVNMDAFMRCLDLTSIPLMYNGDILYLDDIYRNYRCLGARISGLVLGRGIISNPFLPALCKGSQPSNEESIKIVKIFHDDLLSQYRTCSSDEVTLGRMKGLWGYLGFFWGNFEATLKAILRAQSITEYTRILDRYINSNPTFSGV